MTCDHFPALDLFGHLINLREIDGNVEFEAKEVHLFVYRFDKTV